MRERAPRIVLTAAFAGIVAALVAPQPGWAFDDTTRLLASNSRAPETLSALGESLKEVLTPEIGFPAENIEQWHMAVDVAFAPELLEADFLAALDSELTADARSAALAFDASALGRLAADLVESSYVNEPDEAQLAATRSRMEAAAAGRNALFVDLFELQAGPERANAATDVYFRAMRAAATPVVGAEAASQWILSAGDLRSSYVERYFIVTVLMFDQLPDERLRELVSKFKGPEMKDYATQSTTAFAKALHAAAERLELAYAKSFHDGN